MLVVAFPTTSTMLAKSAQVMLLVLLVPVPFLADRLEMV
jgi:hypothetical protein